MIPALGGKQRDLLLHQFVERRIARGAFHRHSDQPHRNGSRHGAAEAHRYPAVGRLGAGRQHSVDLPQTFGIGLGKEHGRQIVAIQPDGEAVSARHLPAVPRPIAKCSYQPGMDQVALPGLAVRDDGNANRRLKWRRGAGGANSAERSTPMRTGLPQRTVRGAQGGGMPAGRQPGRQFAVHLPTIAAGIL